MKFSFLSPFIAILIFALSAPAQNCMNPKIDYDFSNVPLGLYQKSGREFDSRRETKEYSKDSKCASNLTEIACTIMPKKSLVKKGNYFNRQYQVDPMTPTMGQRYDLCYGERFEKQLVPGSCSCFLTADNEVTTAGHCFGGASTYGDKLASCQNSYIVFGFNSEAVSKGYKFDSSQVFECNDIDKRPGKNDPTKGLDITRIQLTSRVDTAKRKPIDLSQAKMREMPKEGRELCLIGSPLGAPLKVALGQVKGTETRMINGISVNIIKSDMDGMAGASGSMVVDCKTGDLMGVYLSGQIDLEKDRDGQKSFYPTAREMIRNPAMMTNKEREELYNQRPVCNRPTRHSGSSASMTESIMWVGDIPDSIFNKSSSGRQAQGVK